MKKRSIVCASALWVLVGALPFPSAAQQSSSSLYGGASLGKSTFRDSCLLGPAPCEHNRDTAYRFFGGYQVNPYIAAELGLAALGHVTVDGSDIKADATDVVGVVTLPLYRRFSALGKLGVYHGVTKSTGIEERKWGPTFGAGLQYDSESRFALRAEWQRYARMAGGDFPAKIDLDVLDIGMLLRF